MPTFSRVQPAELESHAKAAHRREGKSQESAADSWWDDEVTLNVWSAASSQAKCEDVTVGLRKCIRPLLEWITPGQDGMRCALFPISYAVSKDFFRFRVLRAPGSTVVPSQDSPADLERNRDRQKDSLGCSYIGQHRRPIPFIFREHGPSHAGQLIR